MNLAKKNTIIATYTVSHCIRELSITHSYIGIMNNSYCCIKLATPHCFGSVSQLYNMTPELERREFLDKLFSYMQNKGNLTHTLTLTHAPLHISTIRLIFLEVAIAGQDELLSPISL